MKKNDLIKSFLFIFFFFFFFKNGHAVQIQSLENIPIDTPFNTYLNTFYKSSIGIGTIIAFGIIVFGGILYVFAGASPQREGEAKDIILNALWGLLLLLGAYIILRTVNPVLVELNNLGVDFPNVYTNSNTTTTKNIGNNVKVIPQ